MRPIARFVTRPADDAGLTCDLIIGTMMKDCGTKLKPNTIYEIADCLDTLTIREVGQSLVSKGRVADSPIGVSWAQTYDAVAAQAGQWLFISELEYSRILEARRRADEQDD